MLNNGATRDTTTHSSCGVAQLCKIEEVMRCGPVIGTSVTTRIKREHMASAVNINGHKTANIFTGCITKYDTCLMFQRIFYRWFSGYFLCRAVTISDFNYTVYLSWLDIIPISIELLKKTMVKLYEVFKQYHNHRF